MAIIEIAPPDPDAVKARLDVQAKSWARPDALEHREPVDEVEIAYDALNCIHYLQGEITSLRAQLDDARAKIRRQREIAEAALRLCNALPYSSEADELEETICSLLSESSK